MIGLYFVEKERNKVLSKVKEKALRLETSSVIENVKTLKNQYNKSLFSEALMGIRYNHSK